MNDGWSEQPVCLETSVTWNYFDVFQMWMNARWAHRALRGVTTRTARFCVAVIRATSSGQMALPATVRVCSDCSMCLSSDSHPNWEQIKKTTWWFQTSTSAVTPVTCASSSVSTSPGSSPACALRDTSCRAADCVRVSLSLCGFWLCSFLCFSLFLSTLCYFNFHIL